jgi:hypothetical protein
MVGLRCWPDVVAAGRSLSSVAVCSHCGRVEISTNGEMDLKVNESVMAQ